MRQNTIKAAVFLLPAMIIGMVAAVLPVNQACAETRRIIRESSVSTDYLPGPGTPIGTIRSVYGKVFIMHEDMGTIYTAQENLALYAGDTLTTKQNGRISFVMKDDSVLTLAPNTTMVLNEAVFDPVAKRRTSLVDLIAGKARFFVKKFADFQHSTFNVKTKTSIAAVRGSEFIIEQVGDKTIITTMGQTVVEITNTENPLAGTVTVSSFQQLIVELGKLPGNPINISEQELRNILNDLGIPVEEESGEEGGGTGSEQPGGGAFNDQPVSPSVP